MNRLLLSLGVVLAVFGCSERRSEATALPLYVEGREPVVSDYSKAEVDAIKDALSRITFPAAQHTVVRLMRRPVESTPYAFFDAFGSSQLKGKAGGNIVDYWLNPHFVLRVATGYYSDGESHYSMDEWAVVLHRSAVADYKREL